MKYIIPLLFSLAASVTFAGPQITIYNDGFATVKEERSLKVREGVSEIRISDVTRLLEPDSVMVRERGDAPLGFLTEGLLLHQFEGKTLRFEEKREDGTIRETTGRIIRSGYIPGQGMAEQPIVESDGGVRFSLPGQPVFTGIDSTAFLKSSLVWQLASEKAGTTPVELAYITAGMSWEATYNLVTPAEGGDTFDLSGWITLRNETGKTFKDAEIKLIAGDVAKVRSELLYARKRPQPAAMAMADEFGGALPEQRSFDEFHLYTLPRPVLLQNNELKQVEFIRATGVKGMRTYVYNPLIAYTFGGGLATEPDYGTQADKKVGIRIEISNSETNNLGVPLPKGRMRLYRTDDRDGRREFTGENMMDHLPKNEVLKLDMGYAFDLVGERTRTDFSIDTTAKRMTESISISLRNRKEGPVEIRVIEPMFRASNWKLTAQSAPHTLFDSHTAEFRIPVPADGEATLTYTVEYRW
jgi:hypothetical protein